MAKRRRKNGPQKTRTCDHCRKRFTAGNANVRVQECPHCGKPTSAARTKGWWETRADDLLSLIVRYTALDDLGTACCCTCDTRYSVDFLDCGHWQPRSWWSVRWDEFNVHPQCQSCNRPLESWNRSRAQEMMDRHRQYIFNHHGQAEIDRIEALVLEERRGNYRKPTIVDLRELCDGFEAICRGHGIAYD